MPNGKIDADELLEVARQSADEGEVLIAVNYVATYWRPGSVPRVVQLDAWDRTPCGKAPS